MSLGPLGRLSAGHAAPPLGRPAAPPGRPACCAAWARRCSSGRRAGRRARQRRRPVAAAVRRRPRDVTAVPETGRLGGDIPDGSPTPPRPPRWRWRTRFLPGCAPARGAPRSPASCRARTPTWPCRPGCSQAYRSAAAPLRRHRPVLPPDLAAAGRHRQVESGHARGGNVDRPAEPWRRSSGRCSTAARRRRDPRHRQRPLGRRPTRGTARSGPMQFIPSSWALYGARRQRRRQPRPATSGRRCAGVGRLPVRRRP